MLAIAGLVAVTRSGDDDLPAAAHDQDAPTLAVLTAFERAVATSDDARFTKLWDTGAASQRQARYLFSNIEALAGEGFELSAYRSSISSARPTEDDAAVEEWEAHADVAWDATGLGGAHETSSIRLTFVDRGAGPRITALEKDSRDLEPPWLIGPLVVDRAPHLLAATDNRFDSEELLGRLRTAAGDIRAVLPDWHGNLVAYLPSSDADLDAMLAAGSAELGSIAGVAFPSAGWHHPGSPGVIVLEPHFWKYSSDEGRHLVVSHEAAHIATPRLGALMPDWLTEGFADYVGVSALPPSPRLSGAARRQVRDDGLPTTFPSIDDLDTTQDGAGAAYQLSRMAVETLVDEYGTRRFTAFLADMAAGGTTLQKQFRVHFGATRRTVVGLWRVHVAHVLGTS